MHDEFVALVADEGDQESDQPRIGPQVVAQHRSDEQDLHDAVREEVPGAEERQRDVELARIADEQIGDQVVRVLGKLPRVTAATAVWIWPGVITRSTAPPMSSRTPSANFTIKLTKNVRSSNLSPEEILTDRLYRSPGNGTPGRRSHRVPDKPGSRTTHDAAGSLEWSPGE